MKRDKEQDQINHKNILAPKPDGQCKDLPDTGGTTMWSEQDAVCPNSTEHPITGSTTRLYCSDCGIWWWREYKHEHHLTER